MAPAGQRLRIIETITYRTVRASATGLRGAAAGGRSRASRTSTEWAGGSRAGRACDGLSGWEGGGGDGRQPRHRPRHRRGAGAAKGATVSAYRALGRGRDQSGRRGRARARSGCRLRRALARGGAAAVPARRIAPTAALDVLVNNAGIGVFDPVAELDPDDWRAVIETNLNGVFYCCHEAIPLMRKQRRRLHLQHLLAGRQERRSPTAPPTTPASSGSTGSARR